MPGSLNSYLSMVGLTGIALSLLALAIAGRRLTNSRLFILIGLLIIHIAASYFYYEYTKVASADAAVYYFNPWGFERWPFSFGTIAVFRITHFLKQNLDASYLDCFLMFQGIGFTGMVIMYRTFLEIQERAQVPVQRDYFLLLLLPSLNFWTAAIGKDAPLFFSTALCLWSVMNLQKRIVFFVLSLCVMVLFRPYIALIASIALAITAIFGSGVGIVKKMGVLAVAAVAMFLVMGPVKSTFGVDVSSTQSVSTFLDQQSKVFATVEGTTAVGDASFPVRLLSLLFRPFFFDANGVLGLIASAENVLFLFGFFFMVTRRRELFQLAKNVLFVRFAIVFAVCLLISLTMVYYNVGLGLRQRVMAYPMLFSLFVILWSIPRERFHAAGSERASQTAAPQPRFTV